MPLEMICRLNQSDRVLRLIAKRDTPVLSIFRFGQTILNIS
jgi:hypothetical protein